MGCTGLDRPRMSKYNLINCDQGRNGLIQRIAPAKAAVSSAAGADRDDGSPSLSICNIYNYNELSDRREQSQHLIISSLAADTDTDLNCVTADYCLYFACHCYVCLQIPGTLASEVTIIHEQPPQLVAQRGALCRT